MKCPICGVETLDKYGENNPNINRGRLYLGLHFMSHGIGGWDWKCPCGAGHFMVVTNQGGRRGWIDHIPECPVAQDALSFLILSGGLHNPLAKP